MVSTCSAVYSPSFSTDHASSGTNSGLCLYVYSPVTALFAESVKVPKSLLRFILQEEGLSFFHFTHVALAEMNLEWLVGDRSTLAVSLLQLRLYVAS